MSGFPLAINSSIGGGSGLSFLTSANNLLWCVDGGTYATLQSAVDAAVDSTTILVGVKGSGSWGDVVLPANKRINIVGLQGKNGLIAQVNSVTFSPTTGLNINLNQCVLANLFINLATNVNNPALTFGGTAPARLRVYDCYTNTNSGTGYCARGAAGGIFVYDRITFSDSVLQAQNKKIQNTLTLATFSTTPSIVA
ncbi:MAG TPA: hypothetical protein PK079_22630 [Leptospiraceae bacterium]|nr:hypothetical protein [Leptospiraceae bacterium]HNE55979.1 hypothetical protein [Leptospiraceae bacterium]HNF57495.1 hypothetical protein [Leptospiraceae bacterium]